MLIYIMLIVLLDLNVIQEKQPKKKIQKYIHKINSNFTKQEYSRLYQTGSSPGKFYGTMTRQKEKKVALLMTSILDQSFLM